MTSITAPAFADTHPFSLTLVYLYPTLMNIYGDQGNAICLVQRCAWRGVHVELINAGIGDRVDFRDVDIVLIGGAQDRQQSLVANDLRTTKLESLQAEIGNGMVGLAICGGFQLFGRYYRPADGPDLPGIGLFPMYTQHFGNTTPRCIGNVVVDWPSHQRLVGFENHGGRTFLDDPSHSLGRVISGHGNNSTDKTEGARVKNLFGTYLHGSLLPKNPQLTDLLIALALQRRYGAEISTTVMTRPIDDSLERLAHRTAADRALVSR